MLSRPRVAAKAAAAEPAEAPKRETPAPGAVLRTLSEDEVQARGRALAEARLREELASRGALASATIGELVSPGSRAAGGIDVD